MSPLILASGSGVRARMLEAAGVSFTVEPANIDEEGVKQSLVAGHASPRDVADALAGLKALKVSTLHPTSFVLGADQILSLDRTIISKAADIPAAKSLLRRLSGNVHELHSAAALARGGAIVWRHVATARMQMRELSEAFIERYVSENAGAALGAVGSYEFEGRGVQLFSAFSGDFFAVLGLPLLPLLNALREFGLLAV